MFRFETLDIWKLSIVYCNKVYDIAEQLPSKVQYGLGSQIRSSVLSISNNIAEGSGSNSNAEFKSFLNYSVRSTYETVSALFVVKKRKYMSNQNFQCLYEEGELLVKKIRAFR